MPIDGHFSLDIPDQKIYMYIYRQYEFSEYIIECILTCGKINIFFSLLILMFWNQSGDLAGKRAQVPVESNFNSKNASKSIWHSKVIPFFSMIPRSKMNTLSCRSSGLDCPIQLFVYKKGTLAFHPKCNLISFLQLYKNIDCKEAFLSLKSGYCIDRSFFQQLTNSSDCVLFLSL